MNNNLSLFSIFFLFGVSLGSPQGDLMKELFSDYDAIVHPGTPESIGKVNFSITPLCMELSQDGVMDGRVWVNMFWEDDRLTWNPEDYSGMKVLHIPIHRLWKPDIVLYMKKDITETQEEFNAVVYNTGKIIYIPDTKVNIVCSNANLTDIWAVNECIIKYGSWTFDHNMMELNMSETKVEVSEYVEYCPVKTLEVVGELKKKFYDCCPEPYSSIEYKFKLQRKFLRTDAGPIYNPKMVNGIKSIQEDLSNSLVCGLWESFFHPRSLHSRSIPIDIFSISWPVDTTAINIIPNAGYLVLVVYIVDDCHRSK